MTSPFTRLIEALAAESIAHSLTTDSAKITASAERLDEVYRATNILKHLREPEAKVYDRSAYDRCLCGAIEAIDMAIGGDVEDATASRFLMRSARNFLQAAERL